MLIDHGAEVQAPAYASARAGCAKCVATLIRPAGKVSNPTVVPAVAFAYPSILKMLLDYGAVIKADAKMTDMTCLMFAAVSDALPVGIARDLIERGADLNVKSSRGLTALDFARRLGATPMVDLLVKAGAKEGIALADPAMHPKPAATLRAAIERSIPLLQRTDVTFLEKAGCVSCHHNNLTAMAVAAVRRNGIHVDDEISRKQLQAIASYMDTWRERLLQNIGIPGNQDTVSYIFVGIAAENYAPDVATDAAARYLKGRQGSEDTGGSRGLGTLSNRATSKSRPFRCARSRFMPLRPCAPSMRKRLSSLPAGS
jgi:hypothetical protein